MIIYGKKLELSDICQCRNATASDFVWVGYDDSRAMLPVAMACSDEELAEIMGVGLSTVIAAWSYYRRGLRKTTRFAKVYIGGSDDE